jgi:hypothetical protein
MTKYPIIVVVVAGVCLSISWLIQSSSANYDDCILDGMKGVTSNTAALEVKKACRSKYPENSELTALVSLNQEQISRLRIEGKLLSSGGGNSFAARIYNGNSDLQLSSVTILINEDYRHLYIGSTSIKPNDTGGAVFETQGLGGQLNSYKISSAKATQTNSN